MGGFRIGQRQRVIDIQIGNDVEDDIAPVAGLPDQCAGNRLSN